PESQMLAAEKELLGFYISGHPLTAFEWVLEKFNLADTKTLETMPSNTMTRIGGLVSQLEKKFTKKSQKPMATFKLEHLDGAVEAIAFPDTYENYGVHLKEDAPIMICGELVHGDGGTKIKAAEIYPLPDVHKLFLEKISLHLPAAHMDDAKFSAIRDILIRHAGDTPVIICLQFEGGEKLFMDTDRKFKVSVSEKLVHELEHILGEESIYLAINKNPCRRSNGPRNGGHFGYRRSNDF
ncbi:MAG: OB-fold nucleic acid binding domain-containing protein, partial [Lentisphaerota bacterium]